MKIAFDHQVFGWQAYGGISRYLVSLAKELAVFHGVEARVVASAHINGHLRECGHRLSKAIYIPPRLRMSRLVRGVNALTYGALLDEYRPSILHETYYSFGMKPAPCPTVITVHDMIHERFAGLYTVGDVTRLKKASSILRADHIICISESTRRDLLEYFPEVEGRTTVVLHGHAPGSATRTLAVREKDSSTERPFILFVGQRASYKNFRSALAALATSEILKDFSLVAAGGGPLSRAELAEIQKLQLENRVRQLNVSDTDLERLYRQASMLVYPSLYEGFGIPPVEAMAAGCPVVCVNTSSLPEVCGEAAEYAESGAAEAVRLAMERIAQSPERRAALAAAGLRRAADLTWKKCATETYNVYKSLIV